MPRRASLLLSRASLLLGRARLTLSRAWRVLPRTALVACALVLVANIALTHALAGADFTQSLGQARHGHVGMAIAFASLLLLRLVSLLIVTPTLIATVGLALVDGARARLRR